MVNLSNSLIFPLSLTLLVNGASVYAQTASPSVATTDVREAIVNALAQQTIDGLPEVEKPFSFAGHQNLLEVPAFSCQKGDKLGDCLPAGVGALAFQGIKDQSLLSVAKSLGIDQNKILGGSLKNFPGSDQITLTQWVKLDPSIANISLQQLGIFSTSRFSNTIGGLVQSGQGNRVLPEAVISKTAIGQFGNIANVKYGALLKEVPAARQLSLNKYLGVNQLTLDKIIPVGTVPSSLHPIEVDFIRQREEKTVVEKENIISGSNKRPKTLSGDGEVNLVETRSVLLKDSKNVVAFNGGLMQSGDDPRLPGGEGLLGQLTEGIGEPPGIRIPYIGGECQSTLSVHHLDSQKGTVRQQLNFRICYTALFLGFQATPFAIGIPIWDRSETGDTGKRMLLPGEISPTITAANSTSVMPSDIGGSAPKISTSVVSGSSAPALSIAPVTSSYISLFGDANGFAAFNPVTGLTNDSDL